MRDMWSMWELGCILWVTFLQGALVPKEAAEAIVVVVAIAKV